MRAELSDKVWKSAETFIGRVHEATGMAAIVCDDQGIIRKAWDQSRIGKPHSGSQAILRENRTEYVVTAEEVARNPTVKMGCSCVIMVDGEKVGTFGITGAPDVATPVARTSSLLLSSFIRQSQQQALLHETAERIFRDVDNLMERSRSAAERLTSISQSMANAAKEASNRATASGAILKTVSRIAQQSHLLSLNGSIEAARAGEYGRAFSVVVEQMGQLSKDTGDAVASVQDTVEQICDAIKSVDSAIQDSSAMSQDSIRMIGEIAPMMNQLKASMAKLEASFQDE
jgi:hypothetical protein